MGVAAGAVLIGVVCIFVLQMVGEDEGVLDELDSVEFETEPLIQFSPLP